MAFFAIFADGTSSDVRCAYAEGAPQALGSFGGVSGRKSGASTMLGHMRLGVLGSKGPPISLPNAPSVELRQHCNSCADFARMIGASMMPASQPTLRTGNAVGGDSGVSISRSTTDTGTAAVALEANMAAKCAR